jgi:type IV secretory pathway component VirB8
MPDSHEEIAAKIKDGSYYEDALAWYMRRFVYPVTERTYLIIISGILIFAFAISAMNISTLVGENEEIPFPIQVENSTDYFSVIKKLADSSETTQDAVAKYLIIDYLKTREEYFYSEMRGDKLKYKIRKIKSSSSKQVVNEYQNYINDLNPYSPIARYGNQTTRAIEIRSFKFLGNDTTVGKAVVRFEAITQSRNEKEEKRRLWEANIHFRLPDIETIARTGAPLRFLVNYYKAQPVR